MQTLSKLSPLLAKCFFLSLVLPALAAASAVTPGKIPLGDVPPAYLGIDRENNKIQATDYTGKVLVVTFWASWCAPCLNEMQVLENLQRVAKKNVQVIAINIEDRDKYRAVSRTLHSLTLMLAHDYNKSVSAAYGVKGIPHMVIIGRDGRVLHVHRGYGDGMIPRLVDQINAAIAAKPAEAALAGAQ